MLSFLFNMAHKYSFLISFGISVKKNPKYGQNVKKKKRKTGQFVLSQ